MFALGCSSIEKSKEVSRPENAFTVGSLMATFDWKLKGDHPSVRLTEKELDAQVLDIFDTLRVEDDELRDLHRKRLSQASSWNPGFDL